jgi:hypothetical protein
VFVQFLNVPLGDAPRLYVARPPEIATHMKTECDGRGHGALLENLGARTHVRVTAIASRHLGFFPNIASTVFSPNPAPNAAKAASPDLHVSHPIRNQHANDPLRNFSFARLQNI